MLYRTWFSDNLIFSTSLIPEFNMNDRLLKYSFSIGYNISYLDKTVKNIIIDIGYNRSRFNNINNNFDDIKNISIGVNTTFKSYKFLYNLSYNYYEDIENETKIENLKMLQVEKNNVLFEAEFQKTCLSKIVCQCLKNKVFKKLRKKVV